jgi:hypothetical protein
MAREESLDPGEGQWNRHSYLRLEMADLATNGSRVKSKSLCHIGRKRESNKLDSDNTGPARGVGRGLPARNSGIEIRNLIKPLKTDLMPFSKFSYLYFS